MSSSSSDSTGGRAPVNNSRTGPRMLVTCDKGSLLVDTFDRASAIEISPIGVIAHRTVEAGVTFVPVDDAEAMPVEAFPALVGRHVPTLKSVIGWFNFSPTVLSVAELGLVLRCWFISQFLRHLLPTRPLLFVTANGIGATKTSFARALGQLLMGRDFEVSGVARSEDDENVELAAAPYVVIDNIETAARWLTTSLARASTGGRPKKRKLFSDGKLYKINIDVFIALTSATPEFLTGFLLDRMVVARMERPKGPRMPEYVLQDQVAAARPHVLAEVIAVVAEAHRRIRADGLPELVEDIRMADFAAVGSVLAEIMDGPGADRVFVTALVKMQGERVAAVSSTDPLLGALYEIAKTNPPLMGAQELINRLTIVMGAQPAFLALGGDPTRLGKAISALRTRAAGLVDITVTHPGGVARYLVRVAGGGGGGGGGGVDPSSSSPPSGSNQEDTPTTPTTLTSTVEALCDRCGAAIEVGDEIVPDVEAGLIQCAGCGERP